MRQVPHSDLSYTYTIIGDGRMARHFAHYLSLLNIPYEQWSRRRDPAFIELPQVLARSKRLLLLISDDAIADFVEQHVKNLHREPALTVIHFSGSLVMPGVVGAHPLMTFADILYDKNTYQHIAWMLDDNQMDFTERFPGLPNASFYIPAQDKAYYHALCVLSGNFTAMLWQKTFAEFARRWQVPNAAVQPYLKQITQNLCTDAKQALTGPLVRGDMQTIARNQAALQGDAFADVYSAFVEAYQASLGEAYQKNQSNQNNQRNETLQSQLLQEENSDV